MIKKIKILIVDDSALVRNILSHGLAMDEQIEVVGAAGDPYKARDLILKFKPDVLTLDVEMPRMDGLEFLKKLMPQYPLPGIMVSSLTKRGSHTTLEALSNGAIDFVTKPSIDVARGLVEMMQDLQEKVKMAASVDVSKWKRIQKRTIDKVSRIESSALAETSDKVIAIGASTGGTQAIRKIISALPANMPGIVIVQHMPPGFTKQFADRLNDISAMEVKEAQSGDRVMPGRVIVAKGDMHLKLHRSGGVYRIHCTDAELVCGHKPSVDVLFRSVAKHAGPNAIGIMLTGMGADGADAMVEMKEAGAKNICQNEATSVVYGMPKEAFNRGAAEYSLPLEEIPNKIIKLLEQL